jgi:hypothetical protein
MEYGSEHHKKRVIGLRRSARIVHKNKTTDKNLFLTTIARYKTAKAFKALEAVTSKDPNLNRTLVPYNDEYALGCDAVRVARKFSIAAIEAMLNRPDMRAQVTRNNYDTHDEAVHKRAIIGAHPSMGYKQLKVDLPSVRVSIDDDDDVEKVGTPATSNNDEEDHDDDGEDTQKLATPLSDEENEKDDSSYYDEETGLYHLYGINWGPKIPRFDIRKLQGMDSEEEVDKTY